jgi:hypothetical protein
VLVASLDLLPLTMTYVCINPAGAHMNPI